MNETPEEQPSYDQLNNLLYSADPADQADAHTALREINDGPSVAEAAADDRRWWDGEKTGETGA